MKHNNRFIAALLIAILSLLPYSVFAQNERYEIPIGNSVFLGPADAPITIFEFLDFQ